MGLWILQDCIGAFGRAGEPADLGGLIAEAARLPGLRSVIDVDDPVFLPPGDMPRRIANACAQGGEPLPETPAALVRCILDSLALAHRRTIDEARALTGQDIDIVHMVGGGVHNQLLCQLTADALGLPVIAGPAERPPWGACSCKLAPTVPLRAVSPRCGRLSVPVPTAPSTSRRAGRTAGAVRRPGLSRDRPLGSGNATAT